MPMPSQEDHTRKPPKTMPMNKELHYAFITYLEQRELPKHIDKWIILIVQWQHHQFETRKQLLYKISGEARLLAIPEHRKEKTIALTHNRGHLGADNTYYLLKQHTWWPRMEEDIRTFVRTCDQYQKYKQDSRDNPSGSAKIRPEPFVHIGLDIVGPLPVTLQDNHYIIIAVDFFTKWVEAEALKDTNVQNIAEFVHKDIICRHSKPQEITTDRGMEFNNQLIRTLSAAYQIQHIKTTAYHPQGNGQTKRINKTLKAMIGKICKDYQQ